MMGIEPMTSSLPRKRSTPELHRLLRFAISDSKHQAMKPVTKSKKPETHFERKTGLGWIMLNINTQNPFALLSNENNV